MKEITIRQLFREFKSLLPIPIEGIKVNRRDGEAFYIYPNVRQNGIDVRHMSDKIQEEEKILIREVGKLEPVWEGRDLMPVITITDTGWCEGKFEKGVTQKRYLISYIDEYDRLIFNRKWYCKSCIDDLAEKIKIKGGRIDGHKS